MNKTDLVKVVKDTVSETLEGVTAKDTAVFVDAIFDNPERKKLRFRHLSRQNLRLVRLLRML